VPLRPAEVHPQQHFRPVGRLGAAGAGTDRQECVALVVLAAEEQLTPGPAVLLGQNLGLAGYLGQELVVGLLLGEVQQLEGRAGTALEVAPESQLLAQGLGFAQRPLGRALIVPETRFGNRPVQLGQAALFCREVKDAPTSP
jgi:hypothetical protein